MFRWEGTVKDGVSVKAPLRHEAMCQGSMFQMPIIPRSSCSTMWQ
jgi:hypothetical protein